MALVVAVGLGVLVAGAGTTAVLGASAGPTSGEAASDGDGPTVRLAPATANATVDGSTTLDVVVDGVDAGVGSYDLTVGLADPGVALIANVTAAGDPDRQFVTIDGTNRSVRIDAIGTDTDDDGSVRIATVVLTGAASGQTGVSLTVDSVGDENGTRYAVDSTTGAALNVTAGPPTGGTHESGVPRRVFDAVAGADGRLDRGDVLGMVRAYSLRNPVGGVSLSRADVLALVRYYVGIGG